MEVTSPTELEANITEAALLAGVPPGGQILIRLSHRFYVDGRALSLRTAATFTIGP